MGTAPLPLNKILPVLTCADFQRAPFLALAIVGPLGAGKTSLLEATARQLRGKARVAVITINPAAESDADRLSRYCAHVESIKSEVPTSSAVEAVLPRFKFDDIDMLLIESVGGIAGVPQFGQDVTVTVLSVREGHDRAAKYADLVLRSSAIILNKADLQRHVMFDCGTFHADIQRLNPEAKFFEVSTYENRGMDRWLAWLDRQCQQKNPIRHRPKEPRGDWSAG